MKTFDYTDYEYFQEELQKLPVEDREIVEPAVARFLQTKDAIAEEYGTEEVAAVSRLNLFLKAHFGDVESLWQGKNYGAPRFFIHGMEYALAWVNDYHGFDDYGLPRVLYHRHEEFSEILDQLPPVLKELIVENFGRVDPSGVEARLRNRDGYLTAEDFVAWSLELQPNANEELRELIDELGREVTRVNNMVLIARVAAYKRGELRYADGQRSGDRMAL